MVKHRRTEGAVQVRARGSFVARKVLLPAQAFIQIEGISGAFLLAATAVALAWANSPWAEGYFALWQAEFRVDLGFFAVEADLRHWINDGLMVLFFFVVGLEIKRELVDGELADVRRAALPLIAALGGMLVPAALFLARNPAGEATRGWGIPIATDIAFALGVLAVLGRRIPPQLRVLLLALAIADDVGAILAIAVFYTDDLALRPLALALAVVAAIVGLQRAGVRALTLYVLLGVVLWVAVLQSGIHATISGVVLAALTPSKPWFGSGAFADSAGKLLQRFRTARSRGDDDEADAVLGEMEELVLDTESPLDRLERKIHPWSSYVILPLFALANAGVEVSGETLREAAASPVAQGVALGLLLGKPLGVLGFAWSAVHLRLGALPKDIDWGDITGIGLLAGIGYSVSLFVTGLAFEDPALSDHARLGILAASVMAGIAGYAWLRMTTASPPASA